MLASGAEVLPEHYESATPAIRGLGHGLGILSIGGILAAGVIAVQ